jgi:hypothetical protein
MSGALRGLESKADEARHQLWTTLHELDRRRQKVGNFALLVRGNGCFLLKVGAGAVMSALLLAGGLRMTRRRRRRAGSRARVQGWFRAWEHPERLALPPEGKSVGQELGRRLVLIFAGAIAQRLATRAADRLVGT